MLYAFEICIALVQLPSEEAERIHTPTQFSIKKLFKYIPYKTLNILKPIFSVSQKNPSCIPTSLTTILFVPSLELYLFSFVFLNLTYLC